MLDALYILAPATHSWAGAAEGAGGRGSRSTARVAEGAREWQMQDGVPGLLESGG